MTILPKKKQCSSTKERCQPTTSATTPNVSSSASASTSTSSSAVINATSSSSSTSTDAAIGGGAGSTTTSNYYHHNALLYDTESQTSVNSGETVRKKHKSMRNRKSSKTSQMSTANQQQPSQSQQQLQADAFNSGDECETHRNYCDDELEHRFEEHLKKARGLKIKKMRGDGACLFRAVADQIYGDEEFHGTVRKLCMDYMVKNADHFSQFITEDFKDYVTRKREDHVHGNHVEMQAIAEIFSRPIEVYEYSTDPINTFQPEGGKENPPLRLSYHGTVHYNSVVDPFGATIGIGLGLPGYMPGLAEANLMCDALRASEGVEIEEAMLKDKISLTDWQATEQHISEQIARESYLQYVQDMEEKMKEPCHSGSLAAIAAKPKLVRTPPGDYKQPTRTITTSKAAYDERDVPGTSSSCSLRSNSFPIKSSGDVSPSLNITDIQPTDFGLSDWGGDGDILAQVLAFSQQEYLDSLKASKIANDNNVSDNADRIEPNSDNAP